LADSNAEAGEAYDQPVRFGILGRFSDFFGRMPEVVVVDRRGTEPEITYVHRGSSTFDRPEIDEILAELDALRTAE
jgi:peroxiredoxin Q/BCP